MVFISNDLTVFFQENKIENQATFRGQKKSKWKVVYVRYVRRSVLKKPKQICTFFWFLQETITSEVSNIEIYKNEFHFNVKLQGK